MRLRAKRATIIYLKKSETRFERKMRGFAEYKLASNWKSGSDDGDFQKGRKIMHVFVNLENQQKKFSNRIFMPKMYNFWRENSNY